MINDTYLYAGLRTPIGKLSGKLANRSAVDLAGEALSRLKQMHPNVANADGIIMGMTIQAGSGTNPTRVAAHRGGLGLSIPSITLNNACLSGIDSIVDASRRITCGDGQAYLVGGMDSASGTPTLEMRDGRSVNALYQDGLICAINAEHVGVLSERRNRELGISRERQDEWALISQQRAVKANFVETGEMFTLTTESGNMMVDEPIRPHISAEALAKLSPVFDENGTITAGNAPPIADAAAVGVVGSRDYADVIGTEPLVRIVDWAYSAGPDATLHNQPGAATQRLLKKQNLRPSDIDLYEINEAFAGVVLSAMDDLGLPADVVNPNGGAIALGHPHAATAFRQVLTLAIELNRRNLKRGVATLCGAGGQGIAILIDTVN
ncbi:thiolase family protein [Rhodococcus opacus]|uniref:thiolase family protein n=1 Tax=Rhodococcus opacus TaxID=37919 RepID=UPI0029496858|nr:thiolase family protein [Rhodococcus opacus]MDV6244896.1 thiolase family protein [Rhodococcus opacus]